MTDRLEEIRSRAEAATPGPWEIGVTYNHGRNATFIAHAREDIPYLLAEVERLQKDLHPHHAVYDTTCPLCEEELQAAPEPIGKTWYIKLQDPLS